MTTEQKIEELKTILKKSLSDSAYEKLISSLDHPFKNEWDTYMRLHGAAYPVPSMSHLFEGEPSFKN